MDPPPPILPLAGEAIIWLATLEPDTARLTIYFTLD